MALDPSCAFCNIIQGHAPATIIERNPRYIIIEPLAPHAPGHALVIPADHLADVTSAPIRSGHVLEKAARYAEQVGPSNIITSYGAAATQSVFHLHFHVIPRSEDDGLDPDWPWCRGQDFVAHTGLPT